MSAELPTGIHHGRACCGELAAAERREWWLANGRGAYAAGTLAGSLTRRYHGLLIAPVVPPLGRWLLWTKADATLLDGADALPLFTNRWADGSVQPAGHVHIEAFRLTGRLPSWRYAIGDLRLTQRIWMEQGRDQTWVAWRLDPGSGVARPVQLRVNLLVNARDHHGNRSADGPAIDVARGAATAGGDAVHCALPGGCCLTLAAVGGSLDVQPHWHRGFRLGIEIERGLDPIDDNLCIGQATLTLVPGRWVGVTGWLVPAAPVPTGAHPAPPRATAPTKPRADTPIADQTADPVAGPIADPGIALDQALHRERAILARAEAAEPLLRAAPVWVRQLVLAADSFLFARPLPTVPDGESVIAGYPWFTDWGRDTMIALPGLTLVTGRPDSARRILHTYASLIEAGMLPNTFPGAGERAAYNSVDAALWFIEAWRAYVMATDDQVALEAVLPVLVDLIEHHIAGTRYGIGMDPADGLLRAGAPGVQLTWMDAKAGDWVVTPRIGKPVEINALWYNALCLVAAWLERFGHPEAAARDYQALAAQVRTGFRRFNKPDGSGLYDVLDGPDGDDPAIRPNQLFAVSLPHSPLDAAMQAAVLAQCTRELVTSYGLRSLAPGDPAYRPHYRGDLLARDGAYHQGTVWGWLLGPFAVADYRVHGDPERALAWLAPIAGHLTDTGLGTISECFDGAPPHRPCGTPSQAWSVACVLEAWLQLTRARGKQGQRPWTGPAA